MQRGITKARALPHRKQRHGLGSPGRRGLDLERRAVVPLPPHARAALAQPAGPARPRRAETVRSARRQAVRRRASAGAERMQRHQRQPRHSVHASIARHRARLRGGVDWRRAHRRCVAESPAHKVAYSDHIGLGNTDEPVQGVRCAVHKHAQSESAQWRLGDVGLLRRRRDRLCRKRRWCCRQEHRVLGLRYITYAPRRPPGATLYIVRCTGDGYVFGTDGACGFSGPSASTIDCVVTRPHGSAAFRTVVEGRPRAASAAELARSERLSAS
jgi:hypothetical protein